MHLRYFFFLLVFLVATINLHSQGTSPDLVTAVNNPFLETVRPVFEYESNKLVLKLINGFREAVLLTQVELRQTGSKPSSLLAAPVDVSPAETKYINLDPRSIDLSQKIGLELHLTPEPPKQKSKFLFRFERATSQIIEVESEPNP